ncbi:MAG: SUMF1/EgtB/PvdO family nonheme iron enzyme, partial [Lachnospiraceae bacterium]|nr:SUMF1/EgtB/PvdO family nonheme iron enzyme [Lachnospiraceae bacterium]
LYDMTGNVREWCEDPGTGSRSRYVYGGYYSGGLTTLTISSSKSSVTFDFRSNDNLGFRVVRNAPSSSSSTTQKCIVTFDTTTNWPGNTTKVPPQEVFSGGKASAPSISDPTPLVSGEQKHGNFLGWYTKPKPAQNPADPSVTPITPIDSPFDFENTPITTNLTLYAVWDFVYVQGATFEGIETLCKNETNKESGVFIKDRVLPIGNLWVCDHEVTQSEYETYCKYGSTNPSTTTNGNGDNYPAYYVNWYDALVYCNLRSKAEGLTPVYKIKKNGGAAGELTDNPANWVNIVSEGSGDSIKYCGTSAENTDWNNVVCDWNANGYRLPTEAEWEYIARGGNGLSGTQYIYAGSDTIGDVAWYSGNATSTTHVVKRKPANSLGLYDLSGNVWELCWDWCTADVQALQATTGPYGILSGEKRVKRGCSWNNNNPINLPINHRNANTISDRTNIDGFRVVRNADGSAPATPVKHTVTFDTTTNWSGSSLTIEPVQVYDGKKVSRPSGSPADNSVNFRGWFTKPNPSATDTPFNFNTTAINRDLTLYAVYDFVYVAGDVFNSSTTLCAEDDDRVSSVFIGGQFIQLDSLYFCNHEVTQGEYEKYCCYTGTPPSEDEYGNGADYPVYYVSWYDAIVYCNLRSIAEGLTPCYSLGGNTTTTNWTGIKTVTEGGNTKYSCNYTTSIASWNNIVCDWNANGYRLPTIAEWEYAARGGNLTSTGQTIYCGTDGTGDDLGNYAWYGGNSSNITHPVKGKLPNALNLYDMTGNVSELCWDWHPADNTLKAVRSCGFFEAFKLNAMGSDVPYGRRNFIGFRVVRSAGLSNPSVPVKCTVTFDTKTNRPDSSLTIEPVKVTTGKKIRQPSQTPNDPVHFRGWFTKANPSATDTPFNFNTTSITRDLTLYAVWDFVYVEGCTVVGSDDYNQNKDSGTSYISAFPEGRTVTLSSFYMCDHELTQGEYETYCCYTSATPSSSKGGGADYPAYYISWYDAIVYCNLRSMAENL